MALPKELPEHITLKYLYPKKLENLEKFSDAEQKNILSAFRFAKMFHSDQKRIAGPPFIVHPIAVAQLLIDEFDADAETVMGGLLHDTVEDTPATLEDIESHFGPVVRFIVDGATDVGRGDGHPPIKDKQLRLAKTREKIRAFSDKDSRVGLVKIADRWHNLVTCFALRPKNQAMMARFALDFHIPLCRELGFGKQAELFEKAANAVLGRAKQLGGI